MQTLIVLGVVGFFAQLVDGALGMSYGTTSTTLALAVGLSPAVASATVHMAELGTCLASGASHWRFGNVNWRTVRRIGVPGAIGAVLGAVALSSISSAVAKPWMASVLGILGVYILARFALGRAPRPRGRPYVRGRYLAGLGLFGGFIDASGGGGWGAVTTPTLLATGKMEPRKVIGSVDTSEFLVALAASIGFLVALGSQGISWTFLAALLAGGILAAPIAAWLVRLLSPRLLGACVGGLIVMTNARTLLDVAGVPGLGRALAYGTIAVAWGSAVLLVVRSHRRHGVPLTSQSWVGARESAPSEAAGQIRGDATPVSGVAAPARATST